ncbi:MAG TPA: adenosylcobinamide-GDP ribazoletransferase, partial [Arenibaculum sp.]|nr:adenosylcobinamide-GDP ribazoletransferase [Arenibaculum sp.]
DGLGAGLPRPDGPRIVVALVLGAALAGLVLEVAALAAIAAALAAGLAVAALANRQIGGFTGDVLGAAQQAAAILVLLTLAGLAP